MTRRDSRVAVLTRLAEISRARAALRCADATVRARTARVLAQRSERLAESTAESLRSGARHLTRALRIADACAVEAHDRPGLRRLHCANEAAKSAAEIAAACDQLRTRALKELASLTLQSNVQRRLRDAELARMERERRRKRERLVAEGALDLWASSRAQEGDRDDD